MIKFATIFVAVSLLAQVRVSQQQVTVDITCTSTTLSVNLNVPVGTTNPPMRFFFDGKQSETNCFDDSVTTPDDNTGKYEASLALTGAACGASVTNGEWQFPLIYATKSADGTLHSGSFDVKFAGGSCNPNPSETGTKTITVNAVFTDGTATISPSVTVGTVKLVNPQGADLQQATVGQDAVLRVPITTKDIAVCKINTVTLKPDAASTTENTPTNGGCRGPTATDLVTVNNNAADIDCPFKALLWNSGTGGAFGTQIYVRCDFQCCTATGAPCEKSTGCSKKRKRRSADNNALFFNANATITVIEDKPKKQVAEICDGYTSNTVFYVVVVVLAVLLVITIGVAAYFGTRARVVVAGKDNPVFG